MNLFLHIPTWTVKILLTLKQHTDQNIMQIQFKHNILISFLFKKMYCTNYYMCLKAIIVIIDYAKH